MPQSPSLRRIQADIRELAINPSDRYTAAPLESDMLEWHFTIAGPPDSDFNGGLYHGRILLPPDYPFKPPNIVFLTKSGRFETNVKVCLSFSAFHPELWQPAWGIRLILEALIAFLPTPPDGAIGSLNYTPEERRKLALQSVDFYCPLCQKRCHEMLQPTSKYCTVAATADANQQQSGSASIFSKEIDALKLYQQQEHANKTKDVEDLILTAESVANNNETTSGDSARTKAAAVHPSKHGDETTLHGELSKTPAEVETTPDEPRKETESTGVIMGSPEEAEPEPPEPPVQPFVAPRVVVRENPGTTAILQRQSSTVLDPVLHTAMILLSIIAILLLRKIQLLVVDLNELQHK